jgi:hypothetical protein
MGMFDSIRCKYPLPVEGANALHFQTKDTDEQALDEFEIREDGTLWREDYDIEDRSDPTAEGLLAMCGMMTRVNKRWVPCTFTGEICFYTFWDEKVINDDDKTPGWIEFSAYFVGGKLNQVHVTQNRPAGPKEPDATPDDRGNR